jgi:hypothetical protein
MGYAQHHRVSRAWSTDEDSHISRFNYVRDYAGLKITSLPKDLQRTIWTPKSTAPARHWIQAWKSPFWVWTSFTMFGRSRRKKSINRRVELNRETMRRYILGSRSTHPVQAEDAQFLKFLNVIGVAEILTQDQGVSNIDVWLGSWFHMLYPRTSEAIWQGISVMHLCSLFTLLFDFLLSSRQNRTWRMMSTNQNDDFV